MNGQKYLPSGSGASPRMDNWSGPGAFSRRYRLPAGLFVQAPFGISLKRSSSTVFTEYKGISSAGS